ncbi:hypothetical protein LINGRAHAP2_LOCUS25180 [Linum grandiflorum]
MEPEPIENAPVQNNNEEQPLSPPGNPENQPQDAIAQPPLAASSNLTSDVWPHFTRLYLNGILKAKCIYCKKVLAGKSTNVTAAELKTLDGVFSAMAMDDATVEESTDGDGIQSELKGDEDDVAAVMDIID